MTDLKFFNNIRTYSIIAVVIYHAMVSYSTLVPWWYYNSQQTWTGFDQMIIWPELFGIPLLFFVAGFFAQRSLMYHGNRHFIRKKFLQFALPLLIGLFVLCPIMPYLGLLANNATTDSYLSFWWTYITQVSSPYVGWVNPLTHFHHHHLWFLSLLLFFYLLLVIVNGVLSIIGYNQSEHNESKVASRKKIFAALLFIGLCQAISISYLADWTPNTEVWLSLNHILIFQPTRLPLNLGLFILGVLAYQQQWFKHNSFGAMWLVFMSTCILLFVLMFIAMIVFLHNDNVAMIEYGFLRTIMCLLLAGTLLLFARYCWNTEQLVTSGLSKVSFNIYWLHLPIVVLLQIIIDNVILSVLLKYMIVAATSLICCILLASVGRYALTMRDN